jgi:hypothetical protein
MSMDMTWRSTSFQGITVIGSVLLADIAAHLFRSSQGLAALVHSAWGLDALLVVSIWFALRRQLNNLGKLSGQIEEKILARMHTNAFHMALVAYLFLLQALSKR